MIPDESVAALPPSPAELSARLPLRSGARSASPNDSVRRHDRHRPVSVNKGDVDETDYTETLGRLLRAYRRESRAIEVNFRELVPLRTGVDRATHLFHPYPAKLLLNIPLFFLRCSQLGRTGSLRDPFCGTGTVLVEGALAGWDISGADANPLARLITKAKLTHFETQHLTSAGERVCKHAKDVIGVFSPVVDVDFWFPRRVQRRLGGLVKSIESEQCVDLRRFLQVCLSCVVRRVSYADPRIPVPVKASADSKHSSFVENACVHDVFLRVVEENARRLQRFHHIRPATRRALTLSTDARGTADESRLREDVDLVITSPPYVGAQKYIRASSLSIGWLGLAPGDKLRPLERENIGREHYDRADYTRPDFEFGSLGYDILTKIRENNPLRAHIASTYLKEMQSALQETVRRLRTGGHLVLISGNNTVAGYHFPTSRFLAQLAINQGLSLRLELVDDIRSRGLMTKRNRTAGIISREHIHLFRKL